MPANAEAAPPPASLPALPGPAEAALRAIHVKTDKACLPASQAEASTRVKTRKICTVPLFRPGLPASRAVPASRAETSRDGRPPARPWPEPV